MVLITNIFLRSRKLSNYINIVPIHIQQNSVTVVYKIDTNKLFNNFTL